MIGASGVAAYLAFPGEVPAERDRSEDPQSGRGTAPSSGYDLKRIFATTPVGLYQPSSGTLYPALRRLEQRG